VSREHSLNTYLYFETVARRGTLSRAAEELSVSPSAVSQQIKLLEQQLGLKLFRREGRILSLTLEGEQLFQASSTAIRMLRDARRRLGKTHESRRLNLRVSPSFGVRWLGPRLSGFLAAYPGWDIRVDAAPDPTDFDREIMDLDIRYGLGNWQGLHMTPLTNDYVLPLCNPAYRESLPGSAGNSSRLLDSAKLIDSARALCQWDYWLLRNGIETRANSKSILIDRSSMAIQLALDGVGVVLESLALASKEVRAGTLVPLSADWPVLGFPAYWIICPSRHLSRRAVRIFLDWTEDRVADHESEIAAILKSHGLTLEQIDALEELVSGEASRASGRGHS